MQILTYRICPYRGAIHFAIFLLCSTATFADETAEVRTVGGDLVEVEVSEIERVHRKIIKESMPPHEEIFWNSDGSVTITKPRFVYTGRAYPIHSGKSSLEGVCALFGQASASASARNTFTGKASVIVGRNGQYIGYRSNPSIYEDWQIEELTCIPK